MYQCEGSVWCVMSVELCSTSLTTSSVAGRVERDAAGKQDKLSIIAL